MLNVYKINLNLKVFDENVTSEKLFRLNKFVNLNDATLTGLVNALNPSNPYLLQTVNRQQSFVMGRYIVYISINVIIH